MQISGFVKVPQGLKQHFLKGQIIWVLLNVGTQLKNAIFCFPQCYCNSGLGSPKQLNLEMGISPSQLQDAQLKAQRHQKVNKQQSQRMKVIRMSFRAISKVLYSGGVVLFCFVFNYVIFWMPETAVSLRSLQRYLTAVVLQGTKLWSYSAKSDAIQTSGELRGTREHPHLQPGAESIPTLFAFSVFA